MSLPIYQSAGSAHPAAKHQHANTGLWYTRFYNAFEHDWKVGDEGKRGWISKTAGPCGNESALKAAADRMEALGQALGARISDFKTEWHFATGLGLSHPVENGFAWHHTLGVPYLAASGVKGLLRAWIECWKDFASEEERQATILRWFGAAKGEKGDEEGAGWLIFFDALPTSVVSLACDVMTPHMGKWYEKGGEIRSAHDYTDAAPADWHSPNPVPFLVVKKATFRFLIAPRLCGDAAHDQQTQQDVQAAMDELAQALEWLGAGAKTAAGYGRMTRQKTSEEKQAEALSEAGIQFGNEQWLNAKATWDKGKSTLTVTSTEGKAVLSGVDAKAIFDSLSESGQKRLKDGKKNLVVTATIERVGNQNRIITLTEVLPA